MANGWTPERRLRQSQIIHHWKPWTKSTGAKTIAGKKISSKNAVNYSLREVLRELARVNRALIPQLGMLMKHKVWLEECGFFEGIAQPAPSHTDTSKMDSLLNDVEKALKGEVPAHWQPER